jgi:sarcosine oxidase
VSRVRLENVDFVVAGLGALGSATAMELARRRHRVVGLDRFGLGHTRGASHDTSRILRHSYHTPAYVRLTQQAYDDWARLEHDAGERLVTTVGGLDLFPPGAAISPDPYRTSMEEAGVAHAVLSAVEVQRAWPQFRLPPETVALYQRDAAIVPAALGTAVMQREARRHGADLRDHLPVLHVSDLGHGEIEILTEQGTLRCRGLVVCADAWVNEVLHGLTVQLPVEVTLEQVTYFAPERPEDFAPGRLPLWIWMDDPSFYGFPSYGEPTVKAAEDCGGPVVDPDRRTDAPDPAMERRLTDHLTRVLPGAGSPVRSVRCQYTLTPDRDFVLDLVPGHPAVAVGLGAAHGFKFAPTFGRLLADVVESGSRPAELTAFRLGRQALTDPAYSAHWLV